MTVILAPPTDDFLKCMPFMLVQECPYPGDWTNAKNFSDDAHDPGGKTMCGIIQREYDTYRKQKGLPTQDVRKITEEEGYDIYRHSYWQPHCPSLPAGLDLCLFDANVNEASTEGTKILQVALGIHEDGEWGPKTDAAVKAIDDVHSVIELFTARRKIVYRESKGYQYFGKDWIRRATEIGAQALKMSSPS
jgi:lysozyme family protein